MPIVSKTKVEHFHVVYMELGVTIDAASTLLMNLADLECTMRQREMFREGQYDNLGKANLNLIGSRA